MWATSSIAMPPDPHDYGPEHSGSFVILRADGFAYLVTIEPPLPTGEGAPRSYGSKNEAWVAARGLFSDFRLPFQDETEGHFGRRNALKNSSE